MRNIKFLFASIIAIGLSSCMQTEYDNMDPNKVLGQKVEKTISIEQLKSTYMTSSGLFSADKISSPSPVVINGIVTSSDVEGNVYKYLTIQEEGANGHAIKISIDAGSLSGIYPLGQRVSVICNDLYIGKYAAGPQMGIYFDNKARNRIEPGRMPKVFSDKKVIAYGMPVPSAVVADTMTIAQIIAAGPAVYNKLVCIKNAYFTGKGANFGQAAVISEADKIFAPSTNGIGFPQSREITDGTASVFISTSEYAKFANKRIPNVSDKGNITAIIGYFSDKDVTPVAGKIYHQLTLRSLNDLGKGFEAYKARQ